MGDESYDVAPTVLMPRPAVPVSGAHRPHSVGDALRRAREQRGLTLQQIAATTKIPTRHLEALERDDFGAVPAGMYLRAEIRAYAEAVGLSRDVAVGWLDTVVAPADPVDLPPPPPPSPSPRVSARWPALVVAVCVVLIAILLWPANHSGRPTSPAAVVSQTRTAAVTPATAPPAPAPADISTSHRSAPVAVARDAVAATSGISGSNTAVVPREPVSAIAAPAEQHTFEPQLEVVTNPAGARVTVDGVGWGVTPIRIRFLPPGYKHVRVTRDGFAAQERVIDLTTDRPQTSVRMTLRPLE